MDMMLAIPSILLAIAFMAALGRGIDKAIIAIGFVSIPEYARIVRSQVLSVKQADYVAAARVIGDSDALIIFRHVLPNVMPSIIVRATLVSPAPSWMRRPLASWAWACNLPRQSGAICLVAAATTSLPRRMR